LGHRDLLVTHNLNQPPIYSVAHAAASAAQRLSANGLLVTDVWADDLDSASRSAIDRYAFLAGGIAAEQFKFGDYDRAAMRDDQAKVTQRNGGALETYIPEALTIVTTRESCLDRVRRQLNIRWIAARAEAQFYSDSDSYQILSRGELDEILRSC
jgi:hypothetical protein